MGYLDNSSVIVDAILTKKGRELLSRQDGSFKVTQFSLADDEIDYTLYNESHPNGSAFFGEAIENLPLIEAIPNENNTMVSKLVTLGRNTTKIPTITAQTPLNLGTSATDTITPTTNNYDGTENLYSFTIADRRLLSSATPQGVLSTGETFTVDYTGTSLSQTFVGQSLSITTLTNNLLFGSNNVIATSIIIVGVETGARTTVTLNVNKNSSSGGGSGEPASIPGSY